MHGRSVEERIGEYWWWIGGLLFLFVTVDLFTTVYAASVRGIGAEANPIVELLLRRGIPELVLAKLAATVVVVVLASGIMDLIRATDPPNDRILTLCFEIWIGVMFALGLGVVANNITVIFLGRSLI